MSDKLKIPYGYNFSCYIDEDEYIDFVYENGTEDKIIWREYKKDIVVIKEPSKEELKLENQQLKSVLNEVREIVSKSLFETNLVELCRMKNKIIDVLDSVGGSNE